MQDLAINALKNIDNRENSEIQIQYTISSQVLLLWLYNENDIWIYFWGCIYTEYAKKI